MKLICITILFSINIFSSNLFSQTIAVVNIDTLIENYKNYKNTIKNIELSQKQFSEYLDIEEMALKTKSEEIEESKLILSQEEINLQIDDYNNQLNEFTILIEEFNLHYQREIIKIRESILKEIIQLLEKYAIQNNVDLILDSTTYLIVSNSLDITETINNELNKLNLNLEYKDFEKN